MVYLMQIMNIKSSMIKLQQLVRKLHEKMEVIDSQSVFDEKRLKAVVDSGLGDGWKTKELVIKRASNGLTGFLGDHFRATLRAFDGANEATLHLFIKRVPTANLVKAKFINESNFFRREKLLFSLFEELGGGDGPNAWHPKAYYCDDTILIMRDLSEDGFTTRQHSSTLGLPDVQLTVAAVARFHAAFADYITRRNVSQPYNFLEKHGAVMKEPAFCESPWLKASAKLSANLINEYSDKYKNKINELESKLHKLYIAACDSLRDYEDTLNVILHKDLWVNNILFAKDKAILLDYQCVRFGPPAFDLMIFLNLTTSREFRARHEREVLLQYYSVFKKTVSLDTKRRLKELGYDETEFQNWCERSRMFGILIPICIFPYALMEPAAAERHWDNSETYEHYLNEDRTKPVFQYGRSNNMYLQRQVDAIEEFIERYLLEE